MVDFQSQYKLYSYGYTSPSPIRDLPNAADHKRRVNRHLANIHQCRSGRLPFLTDSNDDWEAQLFFHGLKECYEAQTALHHKPQEKPPCSKRELDKLLRQVGIEGSKTGQFKYPRDLITTEDGDIVVVDTNNHRIQIFNLFGVFKKSFGQKGSKEGFLNKPTGIAQMPNKDFVIADSKNNRIQIFTAAGIFKKSMVTKGEPYSVIVDGFKNIIVATSNGTIEIYDRQYHLTEEFNLKRSGKGNIFVKLCPCKDEEFFVVDSFLGVVQKYSYGGRLLDQFQPQPSTDGQVFVPSDLCMDSIGQLVISDCLNHTINVYTQSGELIRHLMGPTDDVGAVFSLSVSAEGHLTVTEFSLSGDHCIKIFRYNPCECHPDRPLTEDLRSPLLVR